MLKKVYPAIFTEQKNGSFLIEVPDMGILTEGKTIEDAMFMARDAIGIKGITMQDKNEEIPAASKLENIDIAAGTFAHDGKGIIALVDIDFDEYRRKHDNKMVRRNVTLPNWLNCAADEAGVNVSQILREALAEKLHVSL